MGSVKLKDLKAYVRYDGSGRVVSGSLVFRKKKPKNGRWVEIPKNLCCDGANPSSTTTTTTQGGGGYNADYNSGAACAGIGLFSLPLILGTSPCTTGAITLAVGTYADYGITNGSNIYINLQDGNLIQVQVFGSSQMSLGCTSCG
jgi:hypothetical protein